MLRNSAIVWAGNNAVVSHSVGILVTGMVTVTLDHNDLWDNETDYTGVTPGDTICLSIRIRWRGCRRLPSCGGSPLIDAGDNASAPDHDFEGEARPLDGDKDGAAIVDVGADEYWSGLRGSTSR